MILDDIRKAMHEMIEAGTEPKHIMMHFITKMNMCTEIRKEGVPQEFYIKPMKVLGLSLHESNNVGEGIVILLSDEDYQRLIDIENSLIENAIPVYGANEFSLEVMKHERWVNE